MSSLRVSAISNTAGTGPVEFTKGVSIPSGRAIVAPNINLTGIVTAASFVGDGSRLIFSNSVTSSKAIALTLIT